MAHDENRFPHADDVFERETSDNGFSKGWGLHHQPAESYIFDCHTHMFATTREAIQEQVTQFFERAGAWRLRCMLALDATPSTVDAFSQVSEKDDRFTWMARLSYDQPDLKFLKEASKRKGFVGVKLHNRGVIENGALPSNWRTPEWQDVFSCCAELKKPVLWHVTQRLTDCPYTGGGRNSYWKVGWPKGVQYTNQDLLDVFLETVEKHPKTNFIGPHHLHMGIEKASSFLQKYNNLFIDFSVGNVVRPFDDMYEADRETWRNHTIQFQDRLLFGTDCAFGRTGNMWYLWETLAGHIRFIHQLRLPKVVLEKVVHENIERLIGMQPLPLNPDLWMFVRP